MDTTEKIHNALEWANKRLELQGEAINENQRNYLVFALRQQFSLTAVSQRSEQFNGKVTLNFAEWTKREGYLKVNHSHYKKGNDLISVEDLISKYWKEENGSLNCG